MPRVAPASKPLTPTLAAHRESGLVQSTFSGHRFGGRARL